MTEYAKKNDFNSQKVAQEIDEYNHIKDSICRAKNVSFIDITGHYRKKGATPEGAAPDGPHPSANIYSYWAKQVSQFIIKEF